MFRSRAADGDDAPDRQAVVFPVVPTRGPWLRRVALALVGVAVTALALAAYVRDAPVNLMLRATQIVPTGPATDPPPAVAAAPTPAVTPMTASPDTTDHVRARRDTATARARVPPPAPARPTPPVRVEPPRPAPAPAHPAASRPAPRPPPVVDTAPKGGHGTLFVSATPWGSVSVDGVVLGNSPIVGASLAAGLHRVRIERDGFVPFDRVISVSDGEVVRLTGIALDPQHGP